MAAGRPDLRLAVAMPNHIKTKMLCKRLGADGFKALIVLWCYAAENHKKGDLAALSDDQIEQAAEWPGQQGAFVSACRDIGWLNDHRLHDWESAQPFIFHAEERSERARKGGIARVKNVQRNAGMFQRNAGATSDSSSTVSSRDGGGTAAKAPPAQNTRPEDRRLADFTQPGYADRLREQRRRGTA